MKKNLLFWLMLTGLIIISSTAFGQDSNAVKNQKQIKAKVNNGKQTQKLHGKNFVDEDGDGYNDNAPDHDGDGIPNGLDEDYVSPGKNSFVDEDGDGINDNATGNGNGARNGFNSNGSLNKNSVRAQNGNVNGAGNNVENTDGSTKSRKGRGGRGN
ncbi:MAG: hypothetical protein IPH62_10100 [Ignavibacteriae bacterium]|nr:hypothetical protein [Ignavibacteriota bacterium]